MYSTGGSAHLEAQQDGREGLRNDNTKVDMVSNSAIDSRISIREIKDRISCLQSRRPLEKATGTIIACMKASKWYF